VGYKHKPQVTQQDRGHMRKNSRIGMFNIGVASLALKHLSLKTNPEF